MENEIINSEFEETQVEIVEDTEDASESTEASAESTELSETDNEILQKIYEVLSQSNTDTDTDDVLSDEQPAVTAPQETTENAVEVVQLDYTDQLHKIHYDLILIIFLCLFFWMYERIKVACRNMKKSM